MKPERIIFALIILAGIAAFILMLGLNLPNSQAKGIIAVGAVFFVLLLWGTSAFFDRKRRREIGEALAHRGVSVGLPTQARFIHTPAKGQRSLTAKFWASGNSTGPLEVAEFTYLTGSGKHTQTHRNMQIIRPTPGAWPDLRLFRRPGLLHRNLTSLGAAQDFGLENEAFTKRWLIECADREFVLLLLSPLVQDWLMLAPKQESWTFADGRIALTHERKCYANDALQLITRLDEFLALLPSELASY